MNHIIINYDKLFKFSKEKLIDEIKFAHKNFFRYGSEASTYKISPDLNILYENPTPRNFLFIINLCEKYTCCQLFRNPYRKVFYCKKYISWREASFKILPKIRNSFRNYLLLERYKDYMIHEAYITCKYILLLGEKKTQLRNIAWRVCKFIGININPWRSVISASRLENISLIWNHYSNQNQYLGTNSNSFDIDINKFIF